MKLFLMTLVSCFPFSLPPFILSGRKYLAPTAKKETEEALAGIYNDVKQEEADMPAASFISCYSLPDRKPGHEILT